MIQPDLNLVIRVKNGEKYISKPLEQFQKIKECHKIIVFDDHSTDNTINISKRYSKVKVVNSNFDTYNEARDRNFCLNLVKEDNPRWACTLDHDEVFEDKIYDNIKNMINVDDPQVLSYLSPMAHHWGDDKHWRVDGLWGSFLQERLFRNLPNQSIDMIDDSTLSGCVPFTNMFNKRVSLIRLRHFGNMEEDVRKNKYEFYTKIYKEKGVSQLALGQWEPYYKKRYGKDKLDPEDYARHLLNDDKTVISEWIDDNSVSLNLIIGDNNIEQCDRMLNNIKSMCDEIIIVYTGNTKYDIIKSIANYYNAKLFKFNWCDDFSAARNFCLKQSTKHWNLRLDYDEMIPADKALKVWNLANRGEVTGYVFPVKNYLDNIQPNPKWFHSQTIRMFVNDPRLQYEGFVHEEIDSSFKKLGKVNIAFSPIPIEHYGYLQPEEVLQAKFEYYHQLNLKQIEKTPKKYYPYHSIGTHYKHIGKVDEAIEWYKKAIQIEPVGFLSHVGLAEICEERNQLEMALDYYIQALNTKNKLMDANMRDYIVRKITNLKVAKEMAILNQ